MQESMNLKYDPATGAGGRAPRESGRGGSGRTGPPPEAPGGGGGARRGQRELLVDNLLVRIHYIIVMIT